MKYGTLAQQAYNFPTARCMWFGTDNISLLMLRSIVVKQPQHCIVELAPTQQSSVKRHIRRITVIWDLSATLPVPDASRAVLIVRNSYMGWITRITVNREYFS